MVTATGEEVLVVAELGPLYQQSDGVWRCPVKLAGLHNRLADIAGEDSLQALCLGASLVRHLLEDVVQKGGKVLHRSDRSEYPLEATFGRIGEPPRGSTI